MVTLAPVRIDATVASVANPIVLASTSSTLGTTYNVRPPKSLSVPLQSITLRLRDVGADTRAGDLSIDLPTLRSLAGKYSPSAEMLEESNDF